MAFRILICALSLSCVHLRTDTRSERGPTLETYERRVSARPGGLRGQVDAQWPKATLTFHRFSLCRVDQVEKFVEEQTIERTAGGGAASLGMGISATLLGGGLLLLLPTFSDELPPAPEGEEVTGITARQWARGFGIGLLIIGIPALGAAAWDLSGAGIQTRTIPKEQVLSTSEVPCEEAPATGSVEVHSPHGPLPLTEVGAEAGKQRQVILQANALLQHPVSGATVDGQDVVFEAQGWDRLTAFASCAKGAGADGATGLSALDVPTLRARLDAAQGCREVPGAPVEVIALLERELAARRASATGRTGAGLESFEDALKAHPPALRVPGSPEDLSRFEKPAAGSSVPVLLRGKIIDFLEPQIAVMDAETVQAWLYLDAARPWATHIRVGANLEVIGVLTGRQQVGQLEAPVVRVVWARPSAAAPSP